LGALRGHAERRAAPLGGRVQHRAAPPSPQPADTPRIPVHPLRYGGGVTEVPDEYTPLYCVAATVHTGRPATRGVAHAGGAGGVRNDSSLAVEGRWLRRTAQGTVRGRR